MGEKMGGIAYIKEKMGFGEINFMGPTNDPMTTSSQPIKIKRRTCLLLITIMLLALMATVSIFVWSHNGNLNSDTHQMIKEMRKNLTAEVGKRDLILGHILALQISKSINEETTITVSQKIHDDQNLPPSSKEKVKPVKDTCGGVILVPDQKELSYHNSEKNEEKCVWLIWTRGLDNVSYNFRTPLGSSEKSFHDLSNLTLYTLNRDNSNSSHGPSSKSIDKGSLQKDLIFENSFGILTTHSKRGQGFHLRLRCPGYCGTSSFRPTVLLLPPTAATASHQTVVNGTVDFRGHNKDERRLTVLRPIRGMKVQIRVTFVRLATSSDFLSIFKLSEDDKDFLLFQTYKAGHSELRHATFTGEEDQPMLIFFHSGHVYYYDYMHTGITFDYNYLPAA